MLKVENLTVSFNDDIGNGIIVDNFSFELNKGEILALVGESGSGKSMTALSIIGLLKKNAEVGGAIDLDGTNLLELTKKERRSYMGDDIAMIFQEPMTSLNPVVRVGKQVEEMIKLHIDAFDKKPSKKEMKDKVIEMFEKVDLPEPEKIYRKYPHELSGGMRQRVMIAMATICNPKILIADEPTTALDVQTQEQILDLLKKISKENNISILMITHDLNVVADMADRIIVMNGGKKVEEGETKQVLTQPKEEYTKKLIASIPRGKKEPEEKSRETIVEVKDLSIYYKEGSKKHYVINNLNFQIHKGEILGLVGRSGLGKTTISKTLLGIHKQYTGEVINKATYSQMVFQDPAGSLNPARTIGWILEEPLRLRGIRDRAERRQLVKEMLENVGLDESFAARHPRELSGGQKQRISIGVALLMDPRLVIADEPVSALDVTVQSQILNLLLKLHAEKQMTILFISHDLNVVRGLCSRVMVIYKGVIVEEGLAEEIYEHPAHPYTKLLLEAAIGGDTMELDAEAGKQSAEPERDSRMEKPERGQTKENLLEHQEKERSVQNAPKKIAGSGEKCIFYERCPKRREACAHVPLSPEAVQLSRTHWARCIQIEA